MAILTLVYLAYMTAGYAVLVLDLLPAYDRPVSYSLIAASFLFAAAILVFSAAKGRRKRENGEPEKSEKARRERCWTIEKPPVLESVFLACAMLFTLAADFFLVILDDLYAVAVAVFFFAQSFHFARFAKTGWKKAPARFLISLGVRILLSIAAVLIVRKALKLDGLLELLAGLYFVELLVNAADAFFLVKRGMRFLLAGIGFVLFILCDITVGLNLMGEGWGIPPETRRVISYLTWVFYTPSQALIVLSGLKCSFKKKGKGEKA